MQYNGTLKRESFVPKYSTTKNFKLSLNYHQPHSRAQVKIPKKNKCPPIFFKTNVNFIISFTLEHRLKLTNVNFIEKGYLGGNHQRKRGTENFLTVENFFQLPFRRLSTLKHPQPCTKWCTRAGERGVRHAPTASSTLASLLPMPLWLLALLP